MGLTKLTCCLLFLAVGGSYAGRGLDAQASGESQASAGRSLLGLTTPCAPKPNLPYSDCQTLPLPSGATCTGCSHGFQYVQGTRWIDGRPNQGCTYYRDCVVASTNAGNPSTTATSGQSGGISSSTTSTSTTTGSGTASTSTSATATLTLNIDGSAFVSTLNNVYYSQCPNGLSEASISDLLVAYVQSCANAYAKCATASSSTGGGSTDVACAIDVTVAQHAEVEALVAGALSFIQTTCGTAAASVNQAYVGAFIQSEFSLSVWTKVKTFKYGGAAYAVSKADVSDLLSAFSSLCFDLYAKTCSCKPTCAFCKPVTVPNCPGTGCPSTTNPSTGITIDGSTNNVAVNYNFYQGTITSIFANAWVNAYNKGCGQYTSVSVWADAYSQAVAHIMADFTLVAGTIGNAQASAGFNFNAVGSAVSSMYADFVATATVAGCTGQCSSCVATAASKAVDVLQSQGFADFCINKCKEVSASSVGAHWDYEPYHQSFTSSFASQPAFTSAVQELDASVGSNCLCGVTPIPTVVASNTP